MTDNDIIPMVDCRFRTIADKEHRAITLAHSGVFTSMGMFSGGSRELDWHLAH